MNVFAFLLCFLIRVLDHVIAVSDAVRKIFLSAAQRATEKKEMELLILKRSGEINGR